MKLTSLPSTHAELLASFRQTNQAVATFFAAIPADHFFAHPDQVWSPAENLVHLLKSVSPVAKALTLPKFILVLRFGRSKAPSRSFESIQITYLAQLAKGAVASGTFVPLVDANPTDAAQTQQSLMHKWIEVSERVLAALVAWDEIALDRYCLPHPLLGRLTMREILFFTIYHNMHHVTDVERLLDQSSIQTVRSLG